MGRRMTDQLSRDAVEMARGHRVVEEGLIHHSDQGSQYASGRFQELLKSYGIQCSMSRRGNCYDNAVVESFFKTVKIELVREQRFKTREEARSVLFEYIEVFYNRKRRHSSLGYLSPVEYERRLLTNETVH